MEANYLREGRGFGRSSWSIYPGLVSQKVPGFQSTELQNALAQVTVRMARIVPWQENLERLIPHRAGVSPQALGVGSAAGVLDAGG